MELEHETLEFSAAEQRRRTLMLRNVSRPSVAMLFKVQCTAPRKLRVRPALGLLVASGDAVSIQVLLNPQECKPATCKLLVVGRWTSSTAAGEVDGELLKTMWTVAEAQENPEALVLSETVNVRIRIALDNAIDDDTSTTTLPAQLTTTRLTTAQLAELVLLIMKSKSQRKENALTTDEQERLVGAQALHPSDWPGWEEYAARLRKLLRERNKRTPQAT